MICCFTCNSTNILKPMDTEKTELKTVAEYLSTEKFCQDVCRSITENMDSSSISRSQVDVQPFPALTNNDPADDDIEGILNEISEILAAQSADNSECTDTALLDSSRSVEDILKDAEALVCTSLTHLDIDDRKEKFSHVPTFNKKPETIIKSSHSKSSHNVKFSDVTETIPFHETNISPFKTRSKSDPDIVLSNSVDKVEKSVEKPKSPRADLYRNPSVHTSENRKIAKELQGRRVDRKKNIDARELRLSDLATVYEGNTPVDSEESGSLHDEGNVDNFISNNTASPNNNKESCGVVDVLEPNNNSEGTLKNNFLMKNIDSSNTQIKLNEKKEKESIEKSENKLMIAERKRLALLEEEVISQEELIASYQRENQRLCSDIITAKSLRNIRISINQLS